MSIGVVYMTKKERQEEKERLEAIKLSRQKEREKSQSQVQSVIENSMVSEEQDSNQYTLGLQVIDETTIESKINDLYKSLESDTEKYKQYFLDRSFLIGKLLTEKKEMIGHGNFSKWVSENLDFGIRQAQNYMIIYNNKEIFKNEARFAFESMRQAISIVKEESKKKVTTENNESEETPVETKSKKEKTDTLEIYENGLKYETGKRKANILTKILTEIQTVEEEITDLSTKLKDKKTRLEKLKKIHSRYWKEN
jgi:hypothetical protein